MKGFAGRHAHPFYSTQVFSQLFLILTLSNALGCPATACTMADDALSALSHLSHVLISSAELLSLPFLPCRQPSGLIFVPSYLHPQPGLAATMSPER